MTTAYCIFTICLGIKCTEVKGFFNSKEYADTVFDALLSGKSVATNCDPTKKQDAVQRHK